MYTHSYYHIQLIPVVALGLVPIIEAIRSRISSETRWLKAALDCHRRFCHRISGMDRAFGPGRAGRGLSP